MNEAQFHARFLQRRDELEALFMQLYDDPAAFETLKMAMRAAYLARGEALHALDAQRESDPQWYKRADMLGMTMYTDLFAGSIRNLISRLPYLKEQKIRYLHLMPLLKMPHPHNDGGYAVEDFACVDPMLGTNEDLAALTKELRDAGISLCLDFVMNHSASTHEWAMRAKAGEKAYQDMYFCYDDRTIPDQFEKTMPEVFPATVPGNFTYCKQMGKWVLTTFHDYQWDLNYGNPAVFVRMMQSMLALANLGVEVLRVDATPYIWKELGTSCRNLPQVHTIVRMVRLVLECVCPAVILKGEVVMAPRELAAYFGTPEKPECHVLYNSSVMLNLWGALAARDVRLLKRQMDVFHSLPAHCWFVNYLRCHDDIGWGFDEDAERALYIDPQMHKEYVYRFYEGTFPGSWSMGELYNYDPATRDARTCGTAASLCGVEKALGEGDGAALDLAVRRMLLLHGVMLFEQGLPMLNCGDEIAQLNGWDYRENEALAHDSRNLHRSVFSHENASLRHEQGTLQERVFSGLAALARLRKEKAFDPDAYVSTWDTGNDGVLALVRFGKAQTMAALFNFTDAPAHARLECLDGTYRELSSGAAIRPDAVSLQAYEMKFIVCDGK
ncbi:MAG: amylosucrase [Clostridia bacterium]|nr:amylosucrase [Clostridia bacterium]